MMLVQLFVVSAGVGLGLLCSRCFWIELSQKFEIILSLPTSTIGVKG